MTRDRRVTDGESLPGGFLAALVGLVAVEAFYAATSLTALRAYDAAPKNRFTAAGDDLSYSLDSLVAGATSLIRDLVLFVVAVAAIHQIRRTGLLGDLRRPGDDQDGSRDNRRERGDTAAAATAIVLGVAAIAFEIVRLCVVWSATYPTRRAYTLCVTACAVEVVAAAAIAVGVVRRSRRQRILDVDRSPRMQTTL